LTRYSDYHTSKSKT